MFRFHRLLLRGERAWRRGEIDAAVRVLEQALGLAPGSVPALYFLGRALHESGQSRRALELLEKARDEERPAKNGAVHRALVHFDTGDDALLDRDIGDLGGENHLSGALRALQSARAGRWDAAKFSATQLWNGEVAGRLLVLLEARYAGLDDAPADDFHYALLAPRPVGETTRAEARAETDGDPPEQPGRPEPVYDPAERVLAMDEAFQRRDFQRVLGLSRARARAGDTPAEPAASYEVYARLRCTTPSDAAKAAERLLRSSRRNHSLHFLHGLSLVRSGDQVRAGHAFVRAFRLDDMELHAVLRQLAAKVRIEWTGH